MNSSFLFPVLLQGAGTAEVEGLSSYLSRLALTHNVPIGVLLRNCYEWFYRKTGNDRPLPNLARNPGCLAQYVRPNDLTRSLLETLSTASSQENLRSGTFLCFDGALSRCMKTFHRSMRWCPVCLAEFEQTGTEPYFKLYWSLTAFTHCSLHGVPLEHLCPHCHARQDGFGVRTSCARCARCKGTLTAVGDPTPPPESWRVEGADIVELLDLIGCTPHLEFPADGVRRLLQAQFDKAWELDQCDRLWKAIPRDQYLAVLFGQVPITLMTVRRLAFRLGVPLLDLLQGSLQQTTGVLDPTWSAQLPKVMRPKRRVARHDRKRLLTGITKALSFCDTSAPRSLIEVARDLKVTTGCLRYHFPTQSKAVLDRHAAWEHSERHRKELEARCAAMSYVAKHDGSRPLTHKGVLRQLRKSTGLPKDLLRKEIALAIDSQWTSELTQLDRYREEK
jgi:hypothetical protein